jgi:hypothetical protein
MSHAISNAIKIAPPKIKIQNKKSFPLDAGVVVVLVGSVVVLLLLSALLPDVLSVGVVVVPLSVTDGVVLLVELLEDEEDGFPLELGEVVVGQSLYAAAPYVSQL